MQALSYPNHVVPKLSVDDVALAEDTVAKIKRAQIARPGTFIAKTYWDVVETLADMLDILEGHSPDTQDRDRKHRSVLRLAEILMLRCTSISDYLGQLLTACAPSGADYGLKQCRQAIAERLGRNVKVPINKTKHAGFTLTPIVLTNGVASVPGFVVYGPLQDGLSGPLSFSSKHGAGTPEGFSLPLFMRQVLANIFAMTDIAGTDLRSGDRLIRAKMPLWRRTRTLSVWRRSPERWIGLTRNRSTVSRANTPRGHRNS